MVQIQTFAQPFIVSGAMNINPDPGCSRALDPDMVLYYSLDLDVTNVPSGNTGHLD